MGKKGWEGLFYGVFVKNLPSKISASAKELADISDNSWSVSNEGRFSFIDSNVEKL
jgi:hypothetical protein